MAALLRNRRILLVLAVLLFVAYFSARDRVASDNPLSMHIRSMFIVVDAGSTGTRLFLYSASEDPRSFWPLVDTLSGPRPLSEIEPGLSSLNLSLVEPYLDALFLNATATLAKHGVQPRVLFYATGGMRSLDEDVRDKVMSGVQLYFARRSELFPSSRVRVIQGHEEGLFGWLAVNYLTHSLDNLHQSSGFLDMGGSSAQISFQVGNCTSVWDGLLLNVSLSGERSTRTISMLSLSIGGFGTKEGMEHFFRSMHVEGSLSALCSCFTRGERFVSSVGADRHDEDRSSDMAAAGHVGSGEFHRCRLHLGNMLDWQCREESVCARLPLAGATMPAQFYAVSEYFHVLDSIASGLDYGRDYFEIAFKASETCMRPSAARRVHDQDICFKSAWVTTILDRLLGTPCRGLRIRAISHIGNAPVHWALGALLFDMLKGHIAAQRGTPEHDSPRRPAAQRVPLPQESGDAGAAAV